MATIADVARAAGVSISTVSRVLSPGTVPHPVRADTAERVRLAARELNFTPSPLARGLAARRSGLIGLIVPDLADPHYPQIAGGVEDGAREIDMAVLICNTFGDLTRMTEYLQLLEQRRVEAIVLSGATSLNEQGLRALEQVTVPLVLIGRPAVASRWAYVTIDNRTGARDATRHLIEQGRRRIVHLAGPRAQTTMADRANGYLDAMQDLRTEVIETTGSAEDGESRFRRRLASREPVDAVFAATDRLAIAAMSAAADVRLHIPNDLAVIGFDDVPLARYWRPNLSTMAQPAELLGYMALEMVQRLSAGEAVEPAVLQAELRARQSTLGPGGRYVED